LAKILADNAQDTRSLEGLLLRVITLSTTQGVAITHDLIQKALGKAQDDAHQHVHADDVIKSVCDYYQIKPTMLRGPKRDAGLVKARQITMFVLYKELKLTLVEIGNFLGGRDHTTVMHGVNKIAGLVEKKDTITQDITGITRLLRG
jgi:chromosomal replication initiator protein